MLRREEGTQSSKTQAQRATVEKGQQSRSPRTEVGKTSIDEGFQQRVLVWEFELLQAGWTGVKYGCLFFRATPSSVGSLRITSSPPSMAHWTLLDCSLGSDSTLIRTVFSSTGRKGTEVVVPGASLVSTWANAGHKNDIQEFQQHL